MRLIFFLFAFLISQCGRASDVVYTFHHLPQKKCLRIHVAIKGEASGKTELDIPGVVWGENASQWIGKITVLTPKATLKSSPVSGRYPARHRIYHPPSQTFEFVYHVCAPENHQLQEGGAYRPQISENAFYFLGDFLLITPLKNQGKNHNIQLNWPVNLKKSFFMNSFGISGAVQKITTSFEKLKNSLYLGGNIDSACLKTKNLCVAFYGDFDRKKKDIWEKIQKITAFHHQFFQDQRPAFMLFGFVNASDFKEEISGTKVHQAVSFFTNPEFQDSHALTHTLTHEHLHFWISEKIPQPSGFHEFENKWFFEGFTDYFAFYLNRKMGLLTQQAYQESYNTCLKKYFTSPFRRASNKEIAANYWNSTHLNELIYLRGRMIAHEVDAYIKRYTKRKYLLDHLMRRMLQYYDKKQTPFSAKLFYIFFQELTNKPFPKNLQKMIEDGNIGALSSDALGEGGQIIWITKRIPDWGFNLSHSFLTGKISEVVPESQAYQMGLRNGRKFIGISALAPDFKKCILEFENEEGKEIEKYFSPDWIGVQVPQYR